jgi:F-type H+-transporting ATPase subunit a
MTAETTPSSGEYILHHLTFNTSGAFNVDTLATALVLGVLGMGSIWWALRRATSGVPGKLQAFFELAIEFIDNEVKSIFHGERHTFVAPLALTVFVWVLLMNAMDFLPVDWVSTLLFGKVLGFHHWRPVPTADINTTFALAISVLLLAIFFSFKVKGVGGYMHELCFGPFQASGAAKFILIPLNFVWNLIEYTSRTLSHSLRLFGNMYAGEIIFLLLGLWASTGVVGATMGALLGAGWGIFHILIVALQAYIFMMLTIVYISLAHEHHH